MRIAVLGSGEVGRTVAAGLAAAGHEVVLGTRDPAKAELTGWAGPVGVRLALPGEAAAHGEVLVNATPGGSSEQALADAGADKLDGTVLLDLANPLDFSGGFPPSLSVSNTDSLAETLQRRFPALRVVKTLNTVNSDLMVNPGLLAEPSAIFVAGDDADAKAVVSQVLGSLGWQADQIVDVGAASAARGTEAYLLLWVNLMGALGTSRFNVRIVREA